MRVFGFKKPRLDQLTPECLSKKSLGLQETGAPSMSPSTEGPLDLDVPQEHALSWIPSVRI